MNLSTHRMLKLLLVTNLYRIKFGHFMEVERDSFNNQLLESFMQAEGIEEIVASFDSEYQISLNKGSDKSTVCILFSKNVFHR